MLNTFELAGFKSQTDPEIVATAGAVVLGMTPPSLWKVSPVVRAKCYEVRSAALGAGGTPSPWQNAGLFTNSRFMTINSLTPGTTYA